MKLKDKSNVFIQQCKSFAHLRKRNELYPCGGKKEEFEVIHTSSTRVKLKWAKKRWFTGNSSNQVHFQFCFKLNTSFKVCCNSWFYQSTKRFQIHSWMFDGKNKCVYLGLWNSRMPDRHNYQTYKQKNRHFHTRLI
mgnify:CR=1 FL=1